GSLRSASAAGPGAAAGGPRLVFTVGPLTGSFTGLVGGPVGGAGACAPPPVAPSLVARSVVGRELVARELVGRSVPSRRRAARRSERFTRRPPGAGQPRPGWGSAP